MSKNRPFLAAFLFVWVSPQQLVRAAVLTAIFLFAWFDLPSSPVIVWAMAVVGTIVHLAAGNTKVPPLHVGAK